MTDALCANSSAEEGGGEGGEGTAVSLTPVRQVNKPQGRM